MRMGAGDPLPGPTDAWTTLAGLARETSRIRLGTLVSSATHRHPAILAIQVAQVDEMSGGRVELGLGTGWFEEEHRAYGIPFPAKRFGPFAGAAGDRHGAVVDAGRRDVLVRRRALHARGRPGPAEARAGADAVIVGGGGPRRTPELAARVRDRVQHRLPARARDRGRCFDGRAGRVRADRPRPVDAQAVRRAADLSPGRPTRRSPGAPQRGRHARSRASATARTSSATPRRSPTKVERLRALGASGCTSSCSTCSDVEHVEYLGTEVLPHLPR